MSEYDFYITEVDFSRKATYIRSNMSGDTSNLEIHPIGKPGFHGSLDRLRKAVAIFGSKPAVEVPRVQIGEEKLAEPEVLKLNRKPVQPSLQSRLAKDVDQPHPTEPIILPKTVTQEVIGIDLPQLRKLSLAGEGGSPAYQELKKKIEEKIATTKPDDWTKPERRVLTENSLSATGILGRKRGAEPKLPPELREQ